MLLHTSLPNFNSVQSVKLKLWCFSYTHYANFDQKMVIFGSKSAIMDFFWIFSYNLKFHNRADKMRPKSSRYHLPIKSYTQKELHFLKSP